jgi:DNA-binding response OmpR family regulator
MPPVARTIVAIVNTNPDLVRLLRVNLEVAGFVVFEIHIEEIKLGEANVSSFLEQHDPKVIVYDVAPPFEMNWRFLDHLRTATGFRGRQFVITTVNERRVREIIGNEETVYEIVGTPDEVETVVRAVKEASRARPTR